MSKKYTLEKQLQIIFSLRKKYSSFCNLSHLVFKDSIGDSDIFRYCTKDEIDKYEALRIELCDIFEAKMYHYMRLISQEENRLVSEHDIDIDPIDRPEDPEIDPYLSPDFVFNRIKSNE